MKQTKRLLVASGMTAALVGVSGPASAIIEGAAGEALLVPFAIYDSDVDGGPDTPFDGLNTLVEITIPSAVGKDTIPNWYTAPNTTPTSVKDPTLNPGADPNAAVTEEFDPDLGPPETYGTARIKVYAFDSESKEVWDDEYDVSPEDFFLLNWGDIVERQARYLDGEKVYLVITNDKANGRWQEAAKFSMFGDAFIMFPTGVGLIDTKIPVIPMSDGDDNATTARCATPGVPCVGNEVVHATNGSIFALSPLTGGMRIGESNGALGEYTLFDLTMSNRFLPTLHVIWVDENIAQENTAYVFNDVEQDCSQRLPIAKELQVYWTSPSCYINGSSCEDGQDGEGSLVPDWVDAALELCYPDGIFTPPVNPIADPTPIDGDFFFPGFVRFQIDEYRDADTGFPEAAAVAFSIQLQVDILTNDREEFVFVPQILPVETALGHERGTFQHSF